MITEMYVVYDKIAQESAQVFHAKSEAVAVRSIVRELAKYDRPDDFDLLHLGSFDHDTCKAKLLEVPEKVEFSMPRKSKEVASE